MVPATSLPLFHLYGDPPDEQAFDFIHIETISSRSSIHDWTIRAHRHANLFQILLIERGGGEMTFEAATSVFAAPAAILLPATVAHGFRFQPTVTEGWVVSFTEDVTHALGERSGEAMARLKALATQPLVPVADTAEVKRLSALCADLYEERFLAREGFRLAMRGYLALIAIEVARLAASRARSGMVTLRPADPTVEKLRRLVEENFRRERLLGFYAEKLSMTPDRLNDHVKRATGVTAGHLIRQRVLTEAKRQLVFTNQPIHEIAYDPCVL
jgi:AraC family transcriptional activator of pobA